MSLTISIDAMGGDFGVDVTVPASLARLQENPALTLILVGDETILNPLLAQALPIYGERLQVQYASQTVDMDESPAKALKNKKDSSMRVAINLVHEKRADACVSAGNTGALMATARFVLKMLAGIDRPRLFQPYHRFTDTRTFWIWARMSIAPPSIYFNLPSWATNS